MGFEMKYLHFFQCPKCDIIKKFVNLEKIPKNSTFESDCLEHGWQMFLWYKTKELLK